LPHCVYIESVHFFCNKKLKPVLGYNLKPVSTNRLRPKRCPHSCKTASWQLRIDVNVKLDPLIHLIRILTVGLLKLFPGKNGKPSILNTVTMASSSKQTPQCSRAPPSDVNNWLLGSCHNNAAAVGMHLSFNLVNVFTKHENRY